MAGISSLLKSAQVTQKKIRAQEDAFAAFEWESSAQTYADFMEYSKYLEDRQTKATDPTEGLTIAGKLRSARRSYVSNELQRQQQAIMEGRASTQDKINAVKSLYDQAVENGDANLAQNLVTQWDTLSIKLQNEAEAAQRTLNTMAAAGVKSRQNALKELVEKLTTKGEDLVQLPNGQVVKPLNILNEELKASGTTQAGQLFQEAADTLAALQQVVVDAYNGSTTQEAADAIREKYEKYVDGTAKIKIGGQELTAQEIGLAAASQDSNNPMFSIASERNNATGELEYKLQKNKTEGITWVKTGENEDGSANYSAIAVQTGKRGQYQNPDAQITDDGYFLSREGVERGKNGELLALKGKTGERLQLDEGNSIRNRIARLGIDAKFNDDGTVDITIPGRGTYQGTIGEDGNLRFWGEPGQFSQGQAGIYEISLFNRPEFGGEVPGGTYGDIREVSQDETSMFGIDSKFGGMLSQATRAGRDVISELSGTVRNSGLLMSPAARIAGMTQPGMGGMSVIGSNLQGSTNVLQKAEGTRTQREQEANMLQAQQRALALTQQAAAFNLNQMGPVQQRAASGAPIKQLTVKPIKPVTNNLRVVNQTAAPTFVTNQPGNQLGVGSGNFIGVQPLPNQGKVTVR